MIRGQGPARDATARIGARSASKVDFPCLRRGLRTIHTLEKMAMSKRLLLVGLMVYALGSRATADTLDVQLFPLSGEIRLHNPNAVAVPFVYYSIKSITNHVGAL